MKEQNRTYGGQACLWILMAAGTKDCPSSLLVRRERRGQKYSGLLSKSVNTAIHTLLQVKYVKNV